MSPTSIRCQKRPSSPFSHSSHSSTSSSTLFPPFILPHFHKMSDSIEDARSDLARNITRDNPTLSRESTNIPTTASTDPRAITYHHGRNSTGYSTVTSKFVLTLTRASTHVEAQHAQVPNPTDPSTTSCQRKKIGL